MADEHKPFHTPVITRQDEEPQFDSSDPNASIWTIEFRTPSGHTSFVRVPSSEYTAENVARAIHEKSRHIEEVGQLKHTEAMMSYR